VGLTVDADSTAPLPFYSKQALPTCQILMLGLYDKKGSFDSPDNERNLLLPVLLALRRKPA
jgi:hypothetical protein